MDQSDILSTFIAARDEGQQITDEELTGHVASLFVAGHELSAIVLTWTVFLLAQHPRILCDVRDELQGELRGAMPGIEQLSRLPLLERVLQESMRLLPPINFWSRVARQESTLGGYFVPEGSVVSVSHFITHRNAAVFPRPCAFEPDRWLYCKPGPFEYMPFSAGPRKCLGASFAMHELKLILATMLQRFYLSLPAGTRVDRAGLLLSKPRGGLVMVAHSPRSQLDCAPVNGNIRQLVELPA